MSYHVLTEDATFKCLHCGGIVGFMRDGSASSSQSQGILTVDKILGAKIKGSSPPPFTPLCLTVATAIDMVGRDMLIAGQPVATSAVMAMTSGGFPLVLDNPGSGNNKISFKPSAMAPNVDSKTQIAENEFTQQENDFTGKLVLAYWRSPHINIQLNDTVTLAVALNMKVKRGRTVKFDIFRYSEFGEHTNVAEFQGTVNINSSGACEATVDWVFDRDSDVNEKREYCKNHDGQSDESLSYFFKATYKGESKRSHLLKIDIHTIQANFLLQDIPGKDGLAPKPTQLIPQFGVFFDGTGNNMGNDMTDPGDDKVATNIVKLYSLYNTDIVGMIKSSYISGVGTRTGQDESMWDTKNLATAHDIGRKIKEAISHTVNHFKLYPGSTTGIIDVFGFSRGAAAARAFVNEVLRLTRADSQNWGGLQPRVRFVGLFDTVGSIGLAGDNHNDNFFSRQGLTGSLILNLHPDSVKKAVQLTAADEIREKFPLSSLFTSQQIIPNNFLEEEWPGVHADIGGGYSGRTTTVHFPSKPVRYIAPGIIESLQRDYEEKYYRPGIKIQSRIVPMWRGNSVAYLIKLFWRRNVRVELAHLILARMHELALREGVPFSPLSTLDVSLAYNVPDELPALVERAKKVLLNSSNDDQSEILTLRYQHLDYKALYENYIHHSHQYAIADNVKFRYSFFNSNEPENHPAIATKNGQREIFYNQPGGGIQITGSPIRPPNRTTLS